METLRKDTFQRQDREEGMRQLQRLDIWQERESHERTDEMRRIATTPGRTHSSPPQRHRSRSRDREGECLRTNKYSRRSCSRSMSPMESGMYDRATKAVLEKLVWPQKNLHYGFLQEGLSFRQLTFYHLVAGEITTIATASPTERRGRLWLLERLAYWMLRGARWEQVRGLYAAVLRGIEAHELSWWDLWEDIESMMINKPETGSAIKPDKQVTQEKSEKGVRKPQKGRETEKREERKEAKVERFGSAGTTTPLEGVC